MAYVVSHLKSIVKVRKDSGYTRDRSKREIVDPKQGIHAARSVEFTPPPRVKPTAQLASCCGKNPPEFPCLEVMFFLDLLWIQASNVFIAYI